MSLMLLLPLVLEEGPKPEDVTAGPIAFLVFGGLILAVVFLGFSLVKQLRKAQAAKDAGVYGDEPAQSADHQSADHQSADHQADDSESPAP